MNSSKRPDHILSCFDHLNGEPDGWVLREEGTRVFVDGDADTVTLYPFASAAYFR